MMENKKVLYCPYCAQELVEEIETSTFYCPYADCPKNIDIVFAARMAMVRLSDFELEEMMGPSGKEQILEINQKVIGKYVLLAIDLFLIYWYFTNIIPINLDNPVFLIIFSVILLSFSIYSIYTFIKTIQEYKNTQKLVKSSQEKHIQKKAEFVKQKLILERFNKLKDGFHEKFL